MKPDRRAVARLPRRRAVKTVKVNDAAEVINCLRRLFKAIQEYSKAIFRRTGLSGPQVWALTVLAGDPGLSLSELSERLFAHPATVSGIVDRLEDRRRRRTHDRPRGSQGRPTLSDGARPAAPAG